MNRKIVAMIVGLMAVTMLATPLIIAQAASYRGSWRTPPTIAAFEATLQTWPDFEYNANPPAKGYLTDEGDVVMKNFRLHGIPPLIEDLGSITLGDYPDGGINLTINGEYTLFGTFEKMVKINIFYGFVPGPPTGVYAVGKWSFEITSVEGTAPDNAVGSTMSGWYSCDTPALPITYISTKGTGLFKGAYMAFTTSATPVWVGQNLFAHEEAEGNILFP